MIDNWYADHYANEPSCANPFGREIITPRNGALHAYLAAGGRLSDYPREKRDPAALIDLLDRCLGLPGALK